MTKMCLNLSVLCFSKSFVPLCKSAKMFFPPPLLLQEVIPTFDMAVNELFFERFPDSILEFQIQVRPYNALKTRNMRSLNPEGA